MSITLKLKADDNFTASKTKQKYICDNTWMDQLDAFHSFLCEQGFVFTYKSFITMYGDIVKNADKEREKEECKEYK